MSLLISIFISYAKGHDPKQLQHVSFCEFLANSWKQTQKVINSGFITVVRSHLYLNISVVSAETITDTTIIYTETKLII